MNTVLNCTEFTRERSSMASHALRSGVTLLTALSTQAMDVGTCCFEGKLMPDIQGFFANSALIKEVTKDFNDIIDEANPHRGMLLRTKFDASYGADDCQSQAFLMMSILRDYNGTVFENLPPRVQTTLKAMHVLTKYYRNIRDEFMMVVDEPKKLSLIKYPTGIGNKNFCIMYFCREQEYEVFERKIITDIGTGLSRTAIANLQRHSRPELQCEFAQPIASRKFRLPQTITTLGFEAIFDYMTRHRIPLMLKVTRILCGVEKDAGQGQGQGLLLLNLTEGGRFEQIPQASWARMMHQPVFVMRAYGVKNLTTEVNYGGMAGDLHRADTFEDYLNTIASGDLRPFLLCLTAKDDLVKGRRAVSEELLTYFDRATEVIPYPIAYVERLKGKLSRTFQNIPLEIPHVYISTLFQQEGSLIDVRGVRCGRRVEGRKK